MWFSFILLHLTSANTMGTKNISSTSQPMEDYVPWMQMCSVCTAAFPTSKHLPNSTALIHRSLTQSVVAIAGLGIKHAQAAQQNLLATRSFATTCKATVCSSKSSRIWNWSCLRLLEWCCPDVDQCTYNLGQINVCLSRFANPFYNKTVAQAREAEIAALGVTSLPSSASSGAPLVSPSPTDNIVLGSTLYATETSISTSSAIMSSTSPSSTSKGTSTSASARTSSTAPKLHNDDADLGKGTIAGITVGTIAGAATGGVAIWLIVKRYQKQRRDVVSKSRPDFVEDFGPRSQAYAPYELRDTSTKPIFEASGRGKPTEMAGQDIRHEVA